MKLKGRFTAASGRSLNIFEPLEPRRLLAAFEFFAERVVVEAEEFDANTPRGAHAWQPVAGGEGTVGGAMQAMPPNQLTIDTNIASTSPRLDYQINFPEAGEHIIWVRGKGVAGSVPTSDSLHVGLNGVVQGGADRMTSFGADWTWSSDTMDGTDGAFEARFTVPSAGVHTVNLYMREDGLAIDRFFISNSSDVRPYVATPGPRASERPTGGSTSDPATVTSSLANPEPIAGPAEVAFDGRNHQVAGVEHFSNGSIAPLPDGRFYLFGRSSGGTTTRYVTRHLPDGSLDTSFADGGRRVLDVESPLIRGPAFPQPGGGFIVWNEDSGGPNLLYRYDANLQPDTSFGGGDGVIAAGTVFAIAPNGQIVTLLLLGGEQAQWTRFDAAGNVVLQVDGPAPHVGAALPHPNAQPYNNTTYTLFDSLEVLSDGSVLVVLEHLDYHGLRKFNPDFSPNTTYAGDGTADLSQWDVDSRHEFMQAGLDGRVIVSERDVDGENYATLVAPDGTTTANDVFYYANGLWPAWSAAFNHTAHFHDDGDVSLAYTISSDLDPVFDGFGVDRFNPDGTRDTSFEGFELTAQQFGDETLRGVDTGLLADGTFIVAANAGSDALLWRVSTGEDVPASVVVDFESAAIGQIASGIYTEDGFTFSNRPGGGGTTLQPLVVHGSQQGYAGKVLSTTNWGRRIDIAKDGGGTFDLASFDYAAGRWGEAGDFTVTGTFAAGGTDTRTASFSGKTLATLALDWTGLEMVTVNFSGGVNAAYGAVDNFVFGEGDGGGGDEQVSVDIEPAAVGQIPSGSYTEDGFNFQNLPGDVGATQTLQPLIVHGPSQGYASKVFSTTNWGRRIDVTHAGESFDIASFDYAAGRWGEAGDIVVRGTFAAGGTITRQVTFNSKTMSTLELDWQDLTLLSINFAGGVNSAYGALDNFVFVV